MYLYVRIKIVLVNNVFLLSAHTIIVIHVQLYVSSLHFVHLLSDLSDVANSVKRPHFRTCCRMNLGNTFNSIRITDWFTRNEI